MFCDFPVLFDNVEFGAIRGEIVQAQRFAALAAKLLDRFALVPGRVIDEQNKPWVLFEHQSQEFDECPLRLSRDESEDELAPGSRTDDVEPFSCVIGFHNGTTAFQRPAS